MGKANLSSLVHELRIAAASSSTPSPNNTSDDDALEVRFRTVLPNLLHAYVLPSSSSSGNEREVIAVVKLISHTARNFPGVFYHGKATSSILPILARILPFFAEPLFRSRHGVFFEATGSLLSLLRSGARDAYRQFFVDSMSLIQGTDKLQLCTRCLCSNTSNLVIAIFLSMIDGLMLICLFSHSQIFYTWLHSVLMDPPGPG